MSSKLSTTTIKLEIGLLLALSIFIFLPKAANAALIVQAPKYIGLNSGLVGYWSFDVKDVTGNMTYVILKT